MLTLYIYLFGIVDSIKAVLSILASIGLFVFEFCLTVGCAMYVVSEGDLIKNFKDALKLLNVIKKCFITSLVTLIIASAIPNKETVAAMIVIPTGVKAIQENEQIVQLPNNILEFINSWLKKQSEELKDEI